MSCPSHKASSSSIAFLLRAGAVAGGCERVKHPLHAHETGALHEDHGVPRQQRQQCADQRLDAAEMLATLTEVARRELTHVTEGEQGLDALALGIAADFVVYLGADRKSTRLNSSHVRIS